MSGSYSIEAQLGWIFIEEIFTENASKSAIPIYHISHLKFSTFTDWIALSYVIWLRKYVLYFAVGFLFQVRSFAIANWTNHLTGCQLHQLHEKKKLCSEKKGKRSSCVDSHGKMKAVFI